MKDARNGTRSLLVGVALLLAAFGTRADESAILADLHSFRISNFVGLAAYYQFSASGDTVTLNGVVESVNSANSAMNALKENDSEVLSEDQLVGLSDEFDKYKELMKQNINDVRQQGYPDMRLMSEMANQAQALSNISTKLYTRAQESSQTDSDQRIEAARSAAVLMAQMMSKYSARSNSSVAQTFQGADTEVPLDAQAKNFDALMVILNAGTSDGDLKRTIDGVSSKWQFIRGSYVNYNDDNVPFIIDRYSKGILEGLRETIELLQQTV
ncbi:MAG: hypothetical protein WD623_01670 [Marinobacter sp.]|uniref:hypothetical protein n=1 Tax=Marinobacter sp. TaxID=50741 RepID=UPI0034A07720